MIRIEVRFRRSLLLLVVATRSRQHLLVNSLGHQLRFETNLTMGKILLVVGFALVLFVCNVESGRCYNSSSSAATLLDKCPEIKEDFLNVHLVPHSHDDVGWLKTVDQYYYGANNSIQRAGVQYIYDSVLEELWKDPTKTFVSVEMEFFHHWWSEQNEKTRLKMAKLVENGQFEFVGGGWCMNDEATTTYADIIDQMSVGLKFINSTFGSCALPTAVWQVDPFGHSREQASIFARMGFKYLFLGRIHYQDKSNRLARKEMEFKWKVSESLDAEIFTGVLYNTYGPPPGFCFDILCNDEPIVDDVNSFMYNVDRKAKQFVSYILEQSKYYTTNNIILTMGEDFHYQYAHAWYKNMDRLIRYINEAYKTSKIRLFYSTPSCYGDAVMSSLTSELPEKVDDFFPYASDPHAYWTGYFTSRPTFKGLVRQSSNLLQVTKQLQSAILRNTSMDLLVFQQNQAIVQHHDAVTGTAKQHVSDDYTKRLHESMHLGYGIISDLYARILPMNDAVPLRYEHCHLLNTSQCHVTERNGSFIVTVYNPLSFTNSHVVRFPIKGYSIAVLGPDGGLVPAQIVPIAENIQKLPGRHSEAAHEMVFLAKDLPPLGGRSYHVLRLKPTKHTRFSKIKKLRMPAQDDLIVTAYGWSLKFDRHSGLLKEVGNQTVLQELFFYPGMAGNNTKFEYRASGAYIFRPNGTALPIGQVSQLITVSGNVITEVHQHFNSQITQIFRMRPDESFLEVDWVVGSIPIDDHMGKEYIIRFTASYINSNGTFYTDSNGREILQRQLDKQATYNVNVTEPTAGNFYPVNAFALVEDKATGASMAVLNDRAQGVSSLMPGSLEFMVHRRLLHDDAFGVGEALNETEYGVGLSVRGSHWLVLNPSSSVIRPLALRRANGPTITFAETDILPPFYRNQYLMEFSLLNRALPPNVHLLTLEPWDQNGSILLRLEHFYAKGEDLLYSKPVSISLKGLFSHFKIDSVDEMDLSGSQKIRSVMPNDEITLRPMEIRSYILTTRTE